MDRFHVKRSFRGKRGSAHFDEKTQSFSTRDSVSQSLSAEGRGHEICGEPGLVPSQGRCPQRICADKGPCGGCAVSPRPCSRADGSLALLCSHWRE